MSYLQIKLQCLPFATFDLITSLVTYLGITMSALLLWLHQNDVLLLESCSSHKYFQTSTQFPKTVYITSMLGANVTPNGLCNEWKHIYIITTGCMLTFCWLSIRIYRYLSGQWLTGRHHNEEWWFVPAQHRKLHLIPVMLSTQLVKFTKPF